MINLCFLDLCFLDKKEKDTLATALDFYAANGCIYSENCMSFPVVLEMPNIEALLSTLEMF